MCDYCCSNFVICYDRENIEPQSDSSRFDRKSDVIISKWKKQEVLTANNIDFHDMRSKNCKISNEGTMNYNIKMFKAVNDLSSVMSKTRAYLPDMSVEQLLTCHNYELDPRADFHNINNIRRDSSMVVKKSSRFLKRPQIFPCFSSIIQSRKRVCRKNIKNISLDAYEPYCAHYEKVHAKSVNKGRHSSSYSSVTTFDSELENISRYYNDKKRLQYYILKEQAKNMSKRRYFRKLKQECFCKNERLLPYQVIATPFWEGDKSFHSNSTYYSELPSTSSGFWDYLTDKITRKQTNRDCYRTKNSKCGQSLSFLVNMNEQDYLRGTERELNETDKKINAILATAKEYCDITKDTDTKENPCRTCYCDCNKKNNESKNVQTCQGTDNPCSKCNNDHTKTDSRNTKGCEATKVEQPCRQPHDDVINKLKRKYNGEILCIHNPPCILINGCLNLPAPTLPRETTACWPVNQLKRPNVYNLYKKMWTHKPKAGKQINLYNEPYASSSQYQVPSHNKKEMDHNFYDKPICELVKLTCKPKYGVSSIRPRHVAMFRKTPKSVTQTKSSEQQQKSKYSQVIKPSKKIVLHRAKNKFSAYLQTKNDVLSPVESMPPKPCSVPIYHKNRLLRMIQVKRSTPK